MSTERILTCITCPIGCELHVTIDRDKVISVTGNTCPRGITYAENECTHPMRTLTTTVRCADGGVLPVKTDRPIPKEKLSEAMAHINSVTAPASVTIGQVLLEGVAGTDAKVVATASKY